MSDQEYPDVLIQADPEDCEHKRRENMDDPAGVECYWRVSGTPQRTGQGGAVLFSDGSEVWGVAFVTRVEDGRLWFTPIRDATALGISPPVDPPQRGFRYVTEAMTDG